MKQLSVLVALVIAAVASRSGVHAAPMYNNGNHPQNAFYNFFPEYPESLGSSSSPSSHSSVADQNHHEARGGSGSSSSNYYNKFNPESVHQPTWASDYQFQRQQEQQLQQQQQESHWPQDPNGHFVDQSAVLNPNEQEAMLDDEYLKPFAMTEEVLARERYMTLMKARTKLKSNTILKRFSRKKSKNIIRQLNSNDRLEWMEAVRQLAPSYEQHEEEFDNERAYDEAQVEALPSDPESEQAKREEQSRLYDQFTVKSEWAHQNGEVAVLAAAEYICDALRIKKGFLRNNEKRKWMWNIMKRSTGLIMTELYSGNRSRFDYALQLLADSRPSNGSV